MRSALGLRIIQDWLLGLELSEPVPAVSTLHRILDEAGLVERGRRPRAPALTPRESKWPEPTAPNDVWAVDFKGEFTVGGRWCHPLTLTDSYSRYVLRIDAQQGQDTHTTQAHMLRAFRKHGLPKAIRCDNGDPFIHAAASQLADDQACGPLPSFGAHVPELDTAHHTSDRGDSPTGRQRRLHPLQEPTLLSDLEPRRPNRRRHRSPR